MTIRKCGMGSHQRLATAVDDWITPPEIIAALGPFDLDPCACDPQPWPTATRMLTIHDNGLLAKWEGRVWMNPPYGRETGRWLGRLAEHGNGIALVMARTETEMFHRHVWPKSQAILFLKGRINFHKPDGIRSTKNCGAPSVLIAYGFACTDRLVDCRIPGWLVRP